MMIRLQNAPCPGDNGANGTCYPRAQCLQLGGIGSGSCAAGFGVCCVCKHHFNKTWNSFTYSLFFHFPSPKKLQFRDESERDLLHESWLPWDLRWERWVPNHNPESGTKHLPIQVTDNYKGVIHKWCPARGGGVLSWRNSGGATKKHMIWRRSGPWHREDVVQKVPVLAWKHLWMAPNEETHKY